MEKVLVTGASGFIGRELVNSLTQKAYDVNVIERYVTGRYVLGAPREIKTYYADLKDYPTIKHVVQEVRPEYVAHLGAVTAVSYSYHNYMEIIETNLNATINLAEACQRYCDNFKQFLFASSSETYGNGPNPKTEDLPQNPSSPYAVAKVACEAYLRYLQEAYKFPVTILRPFNTYGRKHNTHFFIERTIYQMLTQKEVRLGDPNTARDFLYIDDHIEAYLRCLANLSAIGQTFNFCSGKAYSTKQVAEMTSDMTGFTGSLVWNSIPKRPIEVGEIYGDYSNAKNLLGWEPRYSLEQGLRTTVSHWKSVISEAKKV